MDPVLSRFHELLAEAIRERRPGAVNRPVTVAEIYQDLVPYRAVRDRLGIEMNADYEYALVRLLAGEHGLLRLEPPHAREEIAEELESPNPNLGIYRKFAACDVWVSMPPAKAPAATSVDAFEPTGVPGSERLTGPATWSPPIATSPAPEAPPSPTVVADVTPPAAAVDPGVARTSAPSPARVQPPASCAFCNGPLPAEREVRYCPHCGEDQRRQPCIACGEVLEPDWRYCIACGTDNRPAATRV